jgi:hypothetical protein
MILRFDINAVLNFVLFLSLALCSMLIGVLCSWFVEYKADSKAISVLGQKRLDEALAEKKELCPVRYPTCYQSWQQLPVSVDLDFQTESYPNMSSKPRNHLFLKRGMPYRWAGRT